MLKTEFFDLLNSVITDSAEKIRYCFLNKIYNRLNNEDAYELALVDETFSFVILHRTCDLHSILSFGFIYDFSLEDDYLRCNPSVQIDTGDSLSESELNASVGVSLGETIFSLLRLGSDNNFIIIDDKLAESFIADADSTKNWTGLGVTYFHNVKFSKSTMSIFTPIVTEDGLYNKMLAVETNSKLETKHFYFGVPSGISTPMGTYKAKKSINNIDYDIYELEFAPVFDNIGKVLAGPVINTAVQYQACCEFVLKALDDMMHEFYSVDQEEVAWAGGSKQYTTSYKIEFTSDMVKLNKRDRINILNSILKGEEPALSADFRVKYLQNVCSSLDYNEKGIPEINSLNAVMSYIKRTYIWYSSYVMAIKYYLFCSHKKLIDGKIGYLTGGACQNETVVKEGF